MTLATTWIRKLPSGTEELVFATDSRIRFGCAWDCAPKILTLPRSDCAICFAGDTHYAYPLMLQMSAAIDLYSKSRDRAMDIHDLKSHTLKAFNNMREDIHDRPLAQEELEVPEVIFLFGGYSWKQKSFAIWMLHFDLAIKKFTYRPVKNWAPANSWFGNFKHAVFVGDREHVHEAKKNLMNLLRDRYPSSNSQGDSFTFDMEPFEVLRDMLRRSTARSSIGGPPQIVKVYQHMNCRPVGIYWPNRESGQVSVLGRPLLGYETPRWSILDPDTLQTESP
jgi:hypothetical protein